MSSAAQHSASASADTNARSLDREGDDLLERLAIACDVSRDHRAFDTECRVGPSRVTLDSLVAHLPDSAKRELLGRIGHVARAFTKHAAPRDPGSFRRFCLEVSSDLVEVIEHPGGDRMSPAPELRTIPGKPDLTRYCSFCGKSEHQAFRLVAGPNVFICDACVANATDFIEEARAAAPAGTASAASCALDGRASA